MLLYLPVCIFEKFPHELYDNASIKPLTYPQQMRGRSLHVVSISEQR